MKSQFDWEVGEPSDEDTPRRYGLGQWHSSRALNFLLAAFLITLFVIVSWQLRLKRLAQLEESLRREVQTVLDLEHAAFLQGDGELFLSLQSADPAWMSAQLLPSNQDANRSGLTVSRLQTHGDRVWANVSWSNDQGRWHRVVFFQRRGAQFKQIPSDDDYWGAAQRKSTAWGSLAYQQIDEEWVSRVIRYVNIEVERLCADGCLDGKRPFTLVLAPDYMDTAVPDEIRLPSPRLLGLTDAGEPAPSFWEQLAARLASYLTPAQIRIGIPGALDPQIISRYARLAEQFVRQHPDVEIVLELFDPRRLRNDFASLAVEFDGFVLTPSSEMITAGLIKDLTDYVNTDPEFDQVDFYEQIWSGAVWRGRTWFMPQSAEMPLLFYDSQAFNQPGRQTPSLRWTWDEMMADVVALAEAQPADSPITWGLLDRHLDSVIAYAYNWNSRCTEDSPRPCGNPLQPDNIAAALDWFTQIMAVQGAVMDMSMSSESERQHTFINAQTSRRQAAIWVDLPVNYEFQFLMAPLGAVPFPGSDRFDGITPLRVQGHLISQLSPRPLAVWQWLKFISYQPPAPRQIPARPSVAAESGYWGHLPRPLNEAMRSAFPFSRAMTVDERSIISWELVARVLSGELQPEEAAQARSTLSWFSP